MATTTYRVTRSTGSPEPGEFSLVVGGPLFQLMRRTRLSDGALGLVHRRIIAAVLVAWAPLVALTAVQGGRAGEGAAATPLLNDIGFHLRFLVAVPLLIAAEPIAHRWLRPLVDQFQVRGLVRPDEAPRFDDALRDAARLRNSALAEVSMLVAVYAVGVLVTFRRYLALGGYAAASGHGLAPAGAWLVFVSLPLLQFLLLRWYFRLFIWARFLWRASRLDLDLNATHPDKAGGLGFLGISLSAFTPLAMAHGVLFAGLIANRIFYGGARLTDFELEVLGGALFLILVFAGPLALFAPQLARVKAAGLIAYGAVGQTYVRGFRDKWLAGQAPTPEPLLGSGDIQSLADLGNSFAAAEQTRLAPLSLLGLVYFLVAFLAPIAPLALTMMSAEKLISQVAGLLF